MKRNLILLLGILVITACSSEQPQPTPAPTERPTALAGVIPTLPGALPPPTLAIPIAVDDPRFPIEPDGAGQALYEQHCGACHGIDGAGQPPDASGLITAPPHDNSGHTWHHPDQANFATVYTGRHVPGAYPMPAFDDKLSTEEIISILAYIKQWWGEQERATQREITLNFAAERR